MNEKQQSITLERSYDASIDDVWDLWTTKEGIESWWGPEGFAVTVRSLDLRPSGKLIYAMTAVAEPQIAFMKRAGMPLTTETGITYTEVSRHQRLAYINHADFIPGVAPYDVGTAVEFLPGANGVRLRLIIDRMHDETWTQRAVMGWESELGKLERQLLERKRGQSR
jgi:uncharacterized protein YndB with AHSA1/START domain